MRPSGAGSYTRGFSSLTPVLSIGAPSRKRSGARRPVRPATLWPGCSMGGSSSSSSRRSTWCWPTAATCRGSTSASWTSQAPVRRVYRVTLYAHIDAQSSGAEGMIVCARRLLCSLWPITTRTMIMMISRIRKIMTMVVLIRMLRSHISVLSCTIRVAQLRVPVIEVAGVPVLLLLWV